MSGMSSEHELSVPNENLRRLLNDFVHNHPGLKITVDIKARLDRIARAQLPEEWSGFEGRMWGEVEKGLEAADNLPAEEREEYIDAIFVIGDKVDELDRKADQAEARAVGSEARAGKANKRAALASAVSLVPGLLSVILAIAAFF